MGPAEASCAASRLGWKLRPNQIQFQPGIEFNSQEKSNLHRFPMFKHHHNQSHLVSSFLIGMVQEHTHHSKKYIWKLLLWRKFTPGRGIMMKSAKEGEEGRGELRPKEAVKKSPLPNCTEPVGHQRLWAPRRIFNMQHSCPELGLGLIHLHGHLSFNKWEKWIV